MALQARVDRLGIQLASSNRRLAAVGAAGSGRSERPVPSFRKEDRVRLASASGVRDFGLDRQPAAVAAAANKGPVVDNLCHFTFFTGRVSSCS